MDVFMTILKDMWQGLMDWEGGFVFAFLGIGAILVTVIQGIIALVQSYQEA
ncbi:MAG: hypothetical protein WC361_05930 [Bacteroidales bacterium]|jgi:Na+-transporting methylmalonyl-CoA/oxaloacetate decarboxylase gamma subunit